MSLLPSQGRGAGVCEGPFPCARAGALRWREAARQVGARGPISARAPGRALRRGAAARRVGERARFRASPKLCLSARAGSGGRRLLVGRPGCVCGLPVSWRSLCRHARRSSWMARSESAARPFRAPGEPGGGEAVPRASWRLLRDPRNVRRLGVIRGTGPYGFASKTRTKEGLRLASRYTSLFQPSRAPQAHALAPAKKQPPPSPQTRPPGQRNGVQNLLEGPFSATEECVPQSPNDHAAAPREPPGRRPRRPGRPQPKLRPTVV